MHLHVEVKRREPVDTTAIITIENKRQWDGVPGPTDLHSLLTVTGQFLVIIGTLLHVFASRERHSKPTTEVHVHLSIRWPSG